MAPHVWLTHYGAPGLLVLLVLGIFGLPIPDETLLSLAGFLLREGQLRPAATILAALLGSFCGITLSFALGETVGAFLLKLLGNRAHLTPERAERFRRIYARFGPWSLTFGYFVPGFRHFVAIAAGAERMPFKTFALFAYCGALLWVATFLSAGYWLGKEWKSAEHLHRWVLIALLIAGVVALMILLIVRARKRTSAEPAE